MPATIRIWRHHDGALPNLLAFTWVALAHIGGIALTGSGSPWGWLAGVVLTAHSLIIAGYLIHELAHLGIFRSRRLNFTVGEVCSWICGSAYAPFRRIHRMHMRHHGDRADLALFDPGAFLKRCPPWFRRLVHGLEWAYIPAVELIMHYQVVVRPFLNRDFAGDRRRVLTVGVSRLAFFALIFAISPWALAGYALAYLIFLTALFMADAWAHTYDYFRVDSVDQPVPRDGRDAAWDREHTYSNLISTRWPWLNLLNLNFGYHTAHHDRPGTPWYRLPAQHRRDYGPHAPQVLPYRELWRSFRRNRLARIAADDIGDLKAGPGRADDFLGAHGVSFLSIV